MSFIYSNAEAKAFNSSFQQLLQSGTPAQSNLELLDPRILEDAISSIPINGMYTLSSEIPAEDGGGTNFYAINNRTRQRLVRLIKAAAEDTVLVDMVQSEGYIYTLIKGTGVKGFKIEKYTPKKSAYKGPQGSFFNRKLKKALPEEFKNYFAQLQIFDHVKPDQSPCLAYALQQAGATTAELQSVTHLLKGRNVALNDVDRIATAMQKHVTVVRYQEDGATRMTHHGNKSNPTIAIALAERHYFVDVKLPINIYALKNYETVKGKDKFWLFRKAGERKKNSSIRSIAAIDLMMKHEELFFDKIEEANEIMNSIHFEEKELQFNERQIPIPDECSYGQSKIEQGQINRGWVPCDSATSATEKPKKQTKPKTDMQKIISAHQKGQATKSEMEEVPQALTSEEWAEMFQSEKAYTKVGLDFETHTEGKKHKAFLCVVSIEGDAFDSLRPRQLKRFHGEDCGLLALQWLDAAIMKTQTTKGKQTRPVKMIIHNAGYDWCFLQKYLYSPEKLENNGQMISGKGRFGDFENPLDIEVKNSYKLIPEPLGKFGKLFGLKVEKEIMPYNVYTADTVQAGVAPMVDCLKHLPEKDHTQFIENVRKWGCDRIDCDFSDGVDIRKYAAIYCDKDVITMLDGYAKFRAMMFQVTELDIDAMCTLPAIADAFLKKRGCFDGCTIISGMLRAYTQKFVCGGRVMTKDNRKIKTNTIMDDFDACSLYLSALALMPGFPTGKATNFTIKELDDPTHAAIKAAPAAYCKIRITKVGKQYHIPLLNYKDENGTRQYTNDMVGRCVYADSQTIRDLVEFHKIEYEVVNGVYYQGLNHTINDVARELYEWRLKAKAKKNPIQVVLKLLGNSAYGRTLQCARPISVEYLSKDAFAKLMDKHFEEVDEYTIIRNHMGGAGSYRVRRHRSVQDHANYAHVGVSVLSYSKHIMSKVMFLAQDLGISIEYTDTDSMHLARDRVEDLAKAYRLKYETELIGKGIGQFHGDFDLDGADDVYATESIFLGKKAYIDKLVGTGSDGEKVHGHHIRMKGVPGKAIYAKCEQLETHPLHNIAGPMQLFKAHYYGAQISYNLLGAPKGQTPGVSFRYDKCGDVYSQKEFSRTVVF